MSSPETTNGSDGERESTSPGYSDEQVAKARGAIGVWQSKLLDISKGNRLLRFRPTKLTTIPVVSPDLPALFRFLTAGNGSYPVVLAAAPDKTAGRDPDAATPRELPANVLACHFLPDRLGAALYSLRQKAQAAIEERGVNVLFLALGFLCWDDHQEKDVHWRAPLVLVPVALERSGIQGYKIHGLDEDVVLNPTLVCKLAQDYRLALPDLPDDFEHFDLSDYFAQIQAAAVRLPRVEIERSACLSLFQFLKIAMYRDLANQVDALLAHPLTGRLAGLPGPLPAPAFDIPPESCLDPYLEPANTFQVLDADSSQQEALLAARGGASMVLQGPPGTGKSQTIANLIAEAVADGKKVLFVSEKDAALQVVKRRLDECGVGEMCLDLHGHQANKKQILEKLREALEHTAVPALPQATARLVSLSQARDTLNAYVEALHKPRFASALTAFQVYGCLSELRTTPQTKYRASDVETLDQEMLYARRAHLETLTCHASVIEGLAHHPGAG